MISTGRFKVSLVLSLALFAACKGGEEPSTADTLPIDSLPEVVDTVPRTSVTFILGRDQSAYNQYYDMANHYYRLNSDERTEAVVDDLVSLSQVINWLNAHPDTLNRRPYGLINLVSHGNEFIDLQATVTPRGERISAGSLRKAMDENSLPQLDSGIVDSRTLVFLHGCAVGHNQPLLDALSSVFGGEATVKASKLFEYYAYLLRNHNPSSIRHYYARTWYAFYNPDSIADEEALSRQLRRRYPNEKVDWKQGLRRRFQNNPSELYHQSFIVPCRYSEYYANPEDKPSVAGRKKRQLWVDSHADFRSLLDSTHIPQKYFQVKFYRLTTVDENDRILFGLEARARACVVCIIQPLLSTDTLSTPFSPYIPAADDSAIFAFSRPSCRVAVRTAQ